MQYSTVAKFLWELWLYELLNDTEWQNSWKSSPFLIIRRNFEQTVGVSEALKAHTSRVEPKRETEYSFYPGWYFPLRTLVRWQSVAAGITGCKVLNPVVFDALFSGESEKWYMHLGPQQQDKSGQSFPPQVFKMAAQWITSVESYLPKHHIQSKPAPSYRFSLCYWCWAAIQNKLQDYTSVFVLRLLLLPGSARKLLPPKFIKL